MTAAIGGTASGPIRTWGRRTVVLAALMSLIGYFGMRHDVARAATTCAVADPTMTVTIASGDVVTLRQTAGPSVSVVSELVGGAVSCSPTPDLTATTGNVDTIVVNGGAGDEVLVLNLGGGAFVPGKNVEGTGSSEAELTIDLMGGTGDILIVTGSSGADNVTFGAGTPPVGAFNSDGDADLTIANTESLAMNAGGGVDVVSGAGGANVGGAAPIALAMTIDGGANGDTLTGGDGADTLKGGTGNDTESGGAGEDTFFEGEASANGTDTMAGGLGADLVTYYGRSTGVVIYDNGLAKSGQSGENDTVGTDVENLTGTAWLDTIVGNPAANVIHGYERTDKLSGLGGPDFIYGGSGYDTISGGFGGDTLFGQQGRDTITGGDGTDTVTAGDGNDRVFVKDAFADAATGGAGTDCVVKDSLDTVSGFEATTC